MVRFGISVFQSKKKERRKRRLGKAALKDHGMRDG
jgi:hypothetical protein